MLGKRSRLQLKTWRDKQTNKKNPFYSFQFSKQFQLKIFSSVLNYTEWLKIVTVILKDNSTWQKKRFNYYMFFFYNYIMLILLRKFIEIEEKYIFDLSEWHYWPKHFSKLFNLTNGALFLYLQLEDYKHC